jgi:hypothetical protein
MRLAIADPPYLGRAALFYGAGKDNMNANTGARINPVNKADNHPDAAIWDDPAAHRALVERLVGEFDGWAVAMAPDNLAHYLQWTPPAARVAVWHDPQVMPTGRHPRRRWEPVVIYVPEGRRRTLDLAGRPLVGDVLTVAHSAGGGRSFAGRKPAEWTRWVLSMLGWDATADEVVDLFPGSGAVAAVLDQPPLALLGWT